MATRPADAAGGRRQRIGVEQPVGADAHEDARSRSGEAMPERDRVVARVEHEQRHRSRVAQAADESAAHDSPAIHWYDQPATIGWPAEWREGE
jgi:hypothetical protein